MVFEVLVLVLPLVDHGNDGVSDVVARVGGNDDVTSWYWVL